MQREIEYDKNSVDSIYRYALELSGKSLSQVVALPQNVENPRNRGDLGSLVEKYYFRHTPPNDGNPDFAEAGLELKTTGVRSSPGQSFKAKERLVLTKINYEKIVDEKWETSSLLHKCKLMLVVFYLYKRDVAVYEQVFKPDPKLFDMIASLQIDLPGIRRDWETIRQFVLDGKAHELSEGDTNYLKACRKGSGGPNEKLVTQPFSHIKAQSRAFSFGAKFVNLSILENEGKEIVHSFDPRVSHEEGIRARFRVFLGLSIEEIMDKLALSRSTKPSKSVNYSLALRILNSQDNLPVELRKAGITLKTVRIREDGKPRESMSFKSFEYMKLREETWDDSEFSEALEQRFLLVIFRIGNDGIERLEKVGYCNMPYQDRMEAQRVWEETKKRVDIDCSSLPGLRESPIAHVRPHGRNGEDKIPTPQGTFEVRKSFWLNREYIGNIVRAI